MGRRSLADCDMAIYSASVVLNAISVWSLEDQRTGQLAKVITYPVLDLTEMGSSARSEDQIPAKSAST